MSRTYTKQVDGKLVKVDTGDLECLWGDGRYGDRPNYLYRKDEKTFVKESISNWQSERSTIELWDKEKAISFIKKQTQHPTRQLDALEKLGVELESI